MVRRIVPGIRNYTQPAGGWGALRATAKAVRGQMDMTEAPLLLLRTNKPDGFDCPGCAWPDKEHTSTFQFCENGAKETGDEKGTTCYHASDADRRTSGCLCGQLGTLSAGRSAV
jgi:hypothetical protein